MFSSGICTVSPPDLSTQLESFCARCSRHWMKSLQPFNWPFVPHFIPLIVNTIQVTSCSVHIKHKNVTQLFEAFMWVVLFDSSWVGYEFKVKFNFGSERVERTFTYSMYKWPCITPLTANWHAVDFYYQQVPEAFQKLIDNVENTMKHAIEEEEKIPLDTVTNFDEVRNKSSKLELKSSGLLSSVRR